jgi:ubiquinone/menaquinone biosynthesis C-methylase UbiE
LSIENRWDILYRDFPEVYDEFAAVPRQPPLLQVLMQRFDFQDRVVADIGSGSGLSAFRFAGAARKVIGVEIEDAMRARAERESLARGLHNVEFIKGDARRIPLRDSSVEIVTGITLALHPVEGYRDFACEALRVSTSPGLIVMVNITPGWYGGELAAVILDEDTIEDRQNQILVEEFGFEFEDFEANQEYGSLDKIISTYGFIFGKRAIRYLRRNNKTNIRWRFRIHYKKVQK